MSTNNSGAVPFNMSCLCPGPSGSEEALEPVQHPVRQQHGKPLGRHALGLLHSVLHHRGAGLLQHRRPHGTHERQRLPRGGRLHLKVGQPLRLTTTLLPTTVHPVTRSEHVWRNIPLWRRTPPCRTESPHEGNCPPSH